MDRQSIIVHLIKTFTYPISMLNPNSVLYDAELRAKEDICAAMKEIIGNEFRPIEADFFDIEVIEESPFLIRESFKQQYKDKRGGMRDKILFSKTVNTMTVFLLEKKYGPLDKAKNPKIFGKDEDNKNCLLPEIEQEYNQTFQEIHNLLKKERI